MKTIKVRIAVAVDEAGDWMSVGWGNGDGHPDDRRLKNLALGGVGPMSRLYWVAVELPVPDSPEIPGTVEEATS